MMHWNSVPGKGQAFRKCKGNYHAASKDVRSVIHLEKDIKLKNVSGWSKEVMLTNSSFL